MTLGADVTWQPLVDSEQGEEASHAKMSLQEPVFVNALSQEQKGVKVQSTEWTLGYTIHTAIPVLTQKILLHKQYSEETNLPH